MQKFITRFKLSWKVVFSRMKVVWQSCSIVWRSCSVVWRSYSVAFSRVGERGKKLIRPSYVLTRFNTTFIRLSYDSHTPEHEIHTFVIRPEEPITWLSENVGNHVTKINKNMSYEGLAQSYGDRVYFCKSYGHRNDSCLIVWRSCWFVLSHMGVVWQSCLVVWQSYWGRVKWG